MYEQVRKIHLQFSKNGKLSEHGVNRYTTVRQPSSEMKQAVGISYFNCVADRIDNGVSDS